MARPSVVPEPTREMIFQLWQDGRLPAVGAYRPKPRPMHANDPPIIAGQKRLKQLFDRFASRSAQGLTLDVALLLGDKSVYGAIDIGTFCSGSESPLLAWAGLLECLSERTGMDLRLRHKFGAEKCQSKQQYILHMFPEIEALFSDVVSMVHAQAYDVKTQKLRPTPTAFHCAGGFPCQDASQLNSSSRSAANKTCVAGGDLRTGSVLRAIGEFVAQRPEVLSLCLENVAALAWPLMDPKTQVPLGPSNLDCACFLLDRTARMFCSPFLLDPRLFGVPQMRLRLWVACIPRSWLVSAGVSDEECHELFHTIMDSLTGSQLSDINSYLLDEHDPWVMAQMGRHLVAHHLSEGNLRDAMVASDGALPKGKPPSKRARVGSWPALHSDMFEAIGEEAWRFQEPGLETKLAFPGLFALTRRQFEMLHLKGVRSYPDIACRVVDVSQSASRSRRTDGVMPCLTPGGEQYLSNRCRLLFGEEALRMQGVWYDTPVMREKLRTFKNNLLMSLAGNAFELSCYGATLWCSLSVLCILRRRRQDLEVIPASIPDWASSHVLGHGARQPEAEQHSEAQRGSSRQRRVACVDDDLLAVWNA